MAHPSFLIVEDDPMGARSLERALRPHGRAVIATTIAQAKRQLWALSHWAALFVDVCLPDGNGLDVLSDARARYPQTPAMVLTGFLDSEIATRAYDLRAVVLPKPWTRERLEAFVLAAKSPTRSTDIPTPKPRTLDEAVEMFASRACLPTAELDILRRLVAGETVHGIAAARGTSELTVRTQIASLRARADADSVAGLLLALLHASFPGQTNFAANEYRAVTS